LVTGASARVTGARALAAFAAWGAAAAELLGVGLAAVASCAAGVADVVTAGVALEVTAEAADVAADATTLATGLAAGGEVVVALLGEVEEAGVVAAGVVAGGVLGAAAVLVAAAVPCVAGVAAAVPCVAGVAAAVAAEVTVEAAEVTALVTGLAAAGVLAELDASAAGADEGAATLGGGVLGESVAPVAAVVPCAAGATVEVAAELTADVADVTVEVAADVTEEVVDVTAEVSVLVTGEAAGPEAVSVEGAVAACACRENTSKTTRIPAASIAHCAARRAARRKASCGIGGSPPRETGPDTTAHL
jgi:trimeric autotransporter adhesin